MKTEFIVTNPDEIEMEMTIKMTLGQWKKLKNQLADKWPSLDFGSRIQDMIFHATKHFYPKTED